MQFFFFACFAFPSDQAGDAAVMLNVFRSHLVGILATLALMTDILFGIDSMLNS